MNRLTKTVLLGIAGGVTVHLVRIKTCRREIQ